MARQWHQIQRPDEQFADDGGSELVARITAPPLPHYAPQLGFWPAERGSLRWEGNGDLQGSFPGFTAWGGFAENVHIHLTDRYFLVEDGSAHGFGLPLGWIAASMTLTGAGGATLGSDGRFRIRFLDGTHVRGFALRIRGGRFGRGVQRRMQQFAASLDEAELFRVDEDPRYRFPPEIDLSVGWEHAEEYETERVIWQGQAITPVGWSLDHAPCDVWLTTESIIWGTGSGDGLYRLPVGDIIEAVPADLPGRIPVPGIFLTVYVGTVGRIDLPFMFDCSNSVPQNVQDRGAFMVGLRSRGIPIGTPEQPPQPWLPMPPELSNPEAVALPMPPQLRNGDRREPGSRFASHRSREGLPRTTTTENETKHKASEPSPLAQPDLLRQTADTLLGHHHEAEPRAIRPLAAPPRRSQRVLAESGSQIARGVVVPFPNGATPTANTTVSAAEPRTPVVPPTATDPVIATASSPLELTDRPDGETATMQQAAPTLHGSGAVREVPGEGAGTASPRMDPSGLAVMPSLASLVRAELPVGGIEGPLRAPGRSAVSLMPLESYEAAVAQSLAAVQAAIESRLNGRPSDGQPQPVPAADKALALAALERAVQSGALSEQAGAERRERIERTSEAAIRLHSFLHFLDRGYFDLETLRAKRDEIADELLQPHQIVH